jgi:hypothetical protein
MVSGPGMRWIRLCRSAWRRPLRGERACLSRPVRGGVGYFTVPLGSTWITAVRCIWTSTPSASSTPM